MSIICIELSFIADNSAYVEFSTFMAVTSCGLSNAGYSAPCLAAETGNGEAGCVTSMICIALSPGDATRAYVRPFIEIISMLLADFNAKLISSSKSATCSGIFGFPMSMIPTLLLLRAAVRI